jgi:hypothetical protein
MQCTSILSIEDGGQPPSRLMRPGEMLTRTVATFKDQWLIDQFLVIPKLQRIIY